MRAVFYVHAGAAGAGSRIEMLKRHHFQVTDISTDASPTMADAILIDTAGMEADQIAANVSRWAETGSPVLVRFELQRGSAFRDQRAGLLAAGAVDVVRADASDNEVLTRLRAILLQRRAPRILVIEDDEDIGLWVADELRRAGMETVHVAKLSEGRRAFEEGPLDALIVDRQLPDGDGLTFVAELHAAGIRTPALIYSALDTISDRIEGLEHAGAVDYLCKPIHADELIVRVRIALRPINSEETLVFGPLEILRKDKIVRWRGDRIDLRPKEAAMLIYLAERQGLPISQRMLYFDIWEKIYMEEGSNPVSAAKHRLVGNLKAFFKARQEPLPEFLAAQDDSYLFDVEPLLKLQPKALQV